MLVYVFCYSNATARKAQALASRYPFLRPYRLGPSPYFESQFFFFEGLPHDEWRGHDWVGFISYKYLQKIPDDRIEDWPGMCSIYADCDVIALHDYRHNLLVHAVGMHGHPWSMCWRECLSPFLSADSIEDPATPSFYCNYWVARPEWVIRYCDFARGVKQHINGNPALQTMLDSDSKYAGNLSTRALLTITGKPYYTCHAFVFERTPCAFFYAEGAKIGHRRSNFIAQKESMVWRPFSSDDLAVFIPPECRRLCLFASHSEGGSMDGDAVTYAKRLAPQFDRVVVTSTRPVHDILPPNCIVGEVPNQCHDFGQWFRTVHGLRGRTDLEEVTLVNDSCITLGALDPIFDKARQHPEWRFWGVTDSLEVSPHLQTYFVSCRGDAINRLVDFVHRSIMCPRRMRDKAVVISDFEVALSTHMLGAGVPLAAVYPYRKVLQQEKALADDGANPSLGMWDRLLLLGCPLLKKQRLHFDGEDGFIATHKH